MKKIFKILFWFITGIISLILAISLILLIPSVQLYLTGKAVETVEKQFGIKTKIEGIYIRPPKTVSIDGIYIEDQEQDTLLYIGQLRISASIFSLLRQKVNLERLSIEHLTANIDRQAQDSSFNYQFIIDAFASDKSKSPKPETPWEIDAEAIRLKDIAFTMDDAYGGTYINATLGRGDIDIDRMNLNGKEIRFKNIALSGFKGHLDLSDSVAKPHVKKLKTDADMAKTNIPGFLVASKNLDLENIRFSMNKPGSTFYLNSELRHLRSIAPEITLGNLHIDIKDVLIQKIRGHIEMNDVPNQTSISETTAKPDTTAAVRSGRNLFGDFDLLIQLGHGKVEDSYFSMDYPDEPGRETFDYKHMKLKGINFELGKAKFYNDEVSGTIHSLRINDRSGLTIEHLNTDVIFNNRCASLKNLDIKTPDSHISGNMNLDYPAFRDIATKPEDVHINIDVKADPLNSRNLWYFLSKDSTENEELIKERRLLAVIKTSGNLHNFNIQQFKVELDEDSKLMATGTIKGLPEITKTYADIKLDTLYTTGKTIQAFTNQDSLPGNMQLSGILKANASLTGSPDSARLKFRFITDKGFFVAGATVHKTGEVYMVRSNISFSNLQAGLISGMDKLGVTSGNLKSDISIDTAGLQSADGILNIDSIMYNNYLYKNITANLNSSGNKYHLTSHTNNPGLSYDLKADMIKNGNAYQLDLGLELTKIDLKALNFMTRDLRLSGGLSSSLQYYDKSKFSGDIRVNNLRIDNCKNGYLLKEILYTAEVDSLESNYELISDVLDARLNGNIQLVDIPELIIEHTMTYIHGDSLNHKTNSHFEMELKLYEPEILSKFFIPELKEFSLDSFTVQYDNKNNLLLANIRIPLLTYSNIHLDTLDLDFRSSHTALESNLTLHKFSIDTLSIDSLDWSIHTMDKILFSRIIIGDTLQRTYELGMRIDLKDSARILSFIPDQLWSNGVPWTVPEENRIVIKKQIIEANAVNFESKAGSIAFQASDSLIQLLFTDYAIDNLTAIFNNPGIRNGLTGKINGDIQIKNIFSSTKFNADIKATEIKTFGSSPGDLEVKINQPDDSVMTLDVRLNGPENHLTGTGRIGNRGGDHSLDIKTTWEFKNPGVFQPWMAQYVKKIEGTLGGDIKVSGTASHPVPAGTIQFSNFNVNLAHTNTQLGIKNEAINLDQSGLHFGTFHITDSLGNLMIMEGDLRTTDYTSFNFDFDLKTDRFLIINNTQNDLETLYGQLLVAANIKVAGNSRSPVVDSDMQILKETDINYAMTGSDLILQNDEGIVVFSTEKISADSLVAMHINRSVADSLAQKISGLKLNFGLSIDENAKFTLVTNPTSGDFATFKMGGKLNYKYEPSRLGNLTGKITLTEGEYELSFYGLIHKKFTLVSGSFINWSGAVMDGNIHFQATHTVKSNSIGLVGSEVSEAEKANYNQRLPYEVILEVKGILSAPEIAFKIDLPESYRSGQPLIDSKLQSLNQEGMENPRNRQALALLIGGTFIPENTSTGTGQEASFATTAAINSMNSIITRQLNNLSGMLIKDMEINMGFNKIDNYGGTSASSSTRTQLDIGVNKYFLENRVLVGVEGHIDLEGSNPVYKNSSGTQTEFIVQYLLTKNGHYRIKAFRENAFDLIDGEIQNTGVALIFVIDLGNKASDKDKKKKDKRQNN